MGLGNPGSAYAHNRHNVGFWCINRLARRWGIDLKIHSRLATVGSGQVEGHNLTLAKPRTYVNESGRAVAFLLRRLKIDPRRMLVVCDDLDMPTGKIRLRPQGGPGGHNGLKSIIDAIGSQQFPRLRIGIGRPLVFGEPSYNPEVIAGYVLSDPPPDERELLDRAVAQAVEALGVVLAEGIEAAMSRVN